MKFEHAQMLWLLVVIIPPSIWFLYWSWRKKQALMAAFVQARLLSRLLMGFSATRQKVRLGLIIAAAVSSIFAMARPQWGYGWEEAKQRGLDIMVAIDTSRSMLAEDLNPNRLERAKLAALDLRRLAKNDRLGLVAFAGSAFLQCPLTLDDEAFKQSVGALDVGIIPQGGTALAEAIQTAVKSYKDDEDNHKVLVLITDGEDHEEGAITAAKEAAKQGMRIFTIGLGSPDGDFIRVPGEVGKNNFLRDAEGNVVKSRLDEALLQQIASAADGFYLNLRGLNTMETLYDRGLAPLPKTEISSKLVRRYHVRFYIPLALAMLCLLVEIFMPDRARATDRTVTKAAAPAGAIAALLLLAFTLSASASPATAMREYQSGNYDGARKEYEQLIERRPEDPRLQFNAGSAAYKSKKYEEAARSFSAALTAPDLTLQQRAFYNLGNTWYQMGSANEDDDEKMEAWEQAVKQYNGALDLNPDDKDAQYNRTLVKKKLELLKKQMEQQESQEGKEDPNQKPQPGQKGKKKKGKQKGKESGSDPSNEPGEKEKDSKKGRDKKGDKKEEGPGDKEKKDKEGGKEKGDKKDDGKGDQGEQTEAEMQAAMAMGQMTMQQAKQLLDTQKGEERALIFKPTDVKPRTRTFKDW